MDHHFNIEIAEQYGVNAAILLHNITYWVEKNKSEKRHFHNGRYWTYMSKSGLAELFPYMSKKQINYALNKLLDAGLIVTGNFSDNTFDKTTWYALAEDENTEKVPENGLPIDSDKREQSIDTKGDNRLPQKGTIDSDKREQSLNSNIYNNIYNTNKKHTDKNPNKKTTVEDVINAVEDEELQNELREFVRMRKENRRPLTPHAMKLIINDLHKLSRDKSVQLMILQQSIKKGWLGVFELKNPPPTNAGTEMQPTENISELEKKFMQSYEGT